MTKGTEQKQQSESTDKLSTREFGFTDRSVFIENKSESRSGYVHKKLDGLIFPLSRKLWLYDVCDDY